MLSSFLNKYHCRSNGIQNHSTGLKMSSNYSGRSLKYNRTVLEVKCAHKTMFRRKNRPNTLLLPPKFPQLVHSSIHSFSAMCQALVSALR